MSTHDMSKTPQITDVAVRSFDRARQKLTKARIELLGQLAKFSADDLIKSPGEGQWSPMQIAQHVYLTEGLAFDQLRRVQNEDNPEIPDISADAPEHQHDLDGLDETAITFDAVFAGLTARREELFQYLTALPEEAWTRPLRSAAWGNLKMYQIVNIIATHDQQHTKQLAAQLAEQ